ncbi:MAG: glycosyltransferase [Cyanobacteria bacterium J06614_10]
MRKILLIDFAFTGTKGGGHSESYLMSILSTLGDLGYFVYVCSGNNEKLKDNIDKNDSKNCAVVDLDLKTSDKLVRHFLKYLDWLTQKLSGMNYVRFSSLSNLIGVKRLLSELGSELGEDIPVFFAHTDSIMPAVPTGISRFFFPRQWVGLCVLPSYQSKLQFGVRRSRLSFLSEKNFSLASCKGILVLHPLYQRFFRKRFPQLNCLYLPELVSFPEKAVESREPSNLLSRILSEAKGRKIVAMLGNITPRKNFLLFLEAAAAISPSKLFTVVLGRIKDKDNAYYQEHSEAIEGLTERLKGNSLIDTDYYIKSEEEFCSLIEIADATFVHYNKHPFSSNVLAKSIARKKPVVVNKGHLMEKTVRQYNWPAAAKATPAAISEALESIIDGRVRISEEGYADFIADHAPTQFSSSISNVCSALNE